ncbi:DUF4145 domain-containing protein [Fictibacillus halophilus]|uniref:DUF4145 domain-containing protein n=1 Tax=Fictibacillus halophilus TaxID=1610490 RepID=UPI003628E535
MCPQNWYSIERQSPNLPDARIQFVSDTYDFNGPRGYVPPKLLSTNWAWKLDISICHDCTNYTIWENKKIIYPFESELPEAHGDMPEDVKGIYTEATQVYKHSPRAAAALLRLAIEIMIPQLEEYNIKKAKINTMIGELVKQDIPQHVQQGLDAIRIYGNEGIHPGEIVINDDQETVQFLFELINLMVDELITRKKKIKSIYDKLPIDKIKGILNRDKVKEDSK